MSSAPDDRNASRPTPSQASSDASADLPVLPDATPFDLLENRRRRYLVYCLLEHDGEVSLSSAVDVVTAWESDCSVEDVRSTDRRCVYTTLRRTHLPRLETEGVVAYDADAGTVSFGPDAEKVTRWLVGHDEQKWSKYYLGMAAITGALVALELLGVLPMLLPEGGEHVMVALLFVALTAVVTYDSYR